MIAEYGSFARNTKYSLFSHGHTASRLVPALSRESRSWHTQTRGGYSTGRLTLRQLNQNTGKAEPESAVRIPPRAGRFVRANRRYHFRDGEGMFPSPWSW